MVTEMADLAIWKDEQLRQLKAEMNRMLKNFWCDFGSSVFAEVQGEMVVTDIRELADRLVISAELSGLDPADLEVVVSADVLIVSGLRKEARTGPGGLARSSKFSSRIRLPVRIDPDRVEAFYKDNRLEIIMPKSQTAVFKIVTVRRSTN
jgi:HSP20 family protein